MSPCALLRRSVSIGEFSPELLPPGSTLTEQAEPSPCFNPLGLCQDTLGALAPCSGFLPSRPARRPSAVHDAWRHPAESGPPSPGGKFGENSPHLLGNIEEGKSKKKSLAR